MKKKNQGGSILAIIVLLLAIGYFFPNEQENNVFVVKPTHIIYHSNWTDEYDQLFQVQQLQKAYLDRNIQSLDFSLYMSDLSFDQVKQLLPTESFLPYKSIKINLANNPIGLAGAYYVLSLIPSEVSHLEINFDSIDADERLGEVIATKLKQLKLLRHLKISLVLTLKNEQTLSTYLKLAELSTKLQSYSLILGGNGLTTKSLSKLQAHLKRYKLQKLELNLHSNGLSAKETKIVAKSMLSQKNLKQLSLDFSSNRIGRVGAMSLCESLLEINNAQLISFSFNLGANSIGDEGSKAVANLVANMPKLTKLQLGISANKIGSSSFNHFIGKVKVVTGLTEFSLKCSQNKIGAEGAHQITTLITGLANLTKLTLNLYGNKIIHIGAIEITNAVIALKKLNYVYLNFGQNALSASGVMKCLNLLAKKYYNELFVSFSNNKIQQLQLAAIKDDLGEIIQKTRQFELQFVNPQVSEDEISNIQGFIKKTAKENQSQAKFNAKTVIVDEQEQIFKALAQDKRIRQSNGQSAQEI